MAFIYTVIRIAIRIVITSVPVLLDLVVQYSSTGTEVRYRVPVQVLVPTVPSTSSTPFQYTYGSVLA